MPRHDIIVVGASAGGVEALITLTGSLPHNLPAAVFIVLHIPAQSPSLLPEILNRAGRLEAVQATDGMAIEHGHIYVAPSDHHLLVGHGKVRVIHGPKENRHRPAVDPLFRSAAQTYGPRVIGVVLTGALDDGTAGLQAIKQCGGIAVVQDPTDALYPSMPLSALEHVEVDYTVPLSGLGPLLVHLAHEEVPEKGEHPVPEEMEKETQLTELDTADMQSDEHPGTPSAFSCPDCGGVLWETQDGELLRFRCRVGHAYSSESVLAGQDDVLEQALWVALKTLEENIELSRRMAGHAREHGRLRATERFEERQHNAEQRAQVIRQALLKNEPVIVTGVSSEVEVIKEQEERSA